MNSSPFSDTAKTFFGKESIFGLLTIVLKIKLSIILDLQIVEIRREKVQRLRS